MSFDYRLFMSPALRIPPDPVKNLHNSLIYFKFPKSFLDRKARMFVLLNEETKALKHMIPNIVCGATDVLDLDLRRILYSYAHEKTRFPLRFDEHNPLFAKLIVSKCFLDISCFPTEGVDEFYEENFGKVDFDV